MTIRIETFRLIELIGDLRHTADTDPESGAIAGILFHTARGNGFPGDPGRTDLLVGTSTNRFAVGHTYAQAHGQMTVPMLWPTANAVTVVNMFKDKAKASKEHMLVIRAGDGAIHVEEDEQSLFGSGDKYEFAAGDLDHYPRGLWSVLQHDKEWQDSDHDKTRPLPRHDIPAAALAPFVAVAKAHGGTVELYRYHQRRAILVSIGDRYRGFLVGRDWGDDKRPQAGLSPYGEVYPADMPPLPDKTTDTPDPGSLLEQAADMVITVQHASPSTLQRRLRVDAGRAAVLLDELELVGVLGPAKGKTAREVLVHTGELPAVLAAIRKRAATQPADDADEPELTPAE
jgi:S-DNA-T family DNA segregation ATPase FtsK/SpoIIIE